MISLEFLAATMEKALYMKEEKLYNAFKMFDLDGSGKISAEELRQTLGCKKINWFLFIVLLADEKFKEIDKTYWENMIKEADKNGDGEVWQKFSIIYIIYASFFLNYF